MYDVKKNAPTCHRDTSLNARRNVKEREKAPRFPRLGSSLGWLRGLLYRGSGLGILVEVLLSLLGISQVGNAAHSDEKGASNRSDIAGLPGQKWILRRRDRTGKLMFLGTLDHAPSPQELAEYGPGRFSILTVKPNLKGWDSVVIPAKKNGTSKRTSPSSPTTTGATTVRPKNGIGPKMVGSRKVPEGGLEKPTRMHPKQERTSKPVSTKPVDVVTSDVNGVVSKGPSSSPTTRTNVPATKPQDDVKFQKPESKSLLDRRTEDIIRKWLSRADQQTLHREPRSVISSSVDYHPPGQSNIQAASRVNSNEKSQQSTERCPRCRKSSSSLVTCDFCGEILCADRFKSCLKTHNCPQSVSCFNCDRRIPNERAEIAHWCNHFFCGRKCLEKCWMENREEEECKPCSAGAVGDGPEGEEGKKGGVEIRNENLPEQEGAEIEEEEGHEYECDRCGADVSSKAEACPGCGSIFEEENTESEHEASTKEEKGPQEMCNGQSKEKACRKCQEENCQGRHCDGYCNLCNFHYCEDRCENDGLCKTCEDYAECEIRCREAPERCDKRHCQGFECRDRTLSASDCDYDCENCGDIGCYFFDHPADEEEGDES